jgi:hypothetical protein
VAGRPPAADPEPGGPWRAWPDQRSRVTSGWSRGLRNHDRAGSNGRCRLAVWARASVSSISVLARLGGSLRRQWLFAMPRVVMPPPGTSSKWSSGRMPARVYIWCCLRTRPRRVRLVVPPASCSDTPRLRRPVRRDTRREACRARRRDSCGTPQRFRGNVSSAYPIDFAGATPGRPTFRSFRGLPPAHPRNDNRGGNDPVGTTSPTERA